MPGRAKHIGLNQVSVCEVKAGAHTSTLPLCTHSYYQQLSPPPVLPFPIYNHFLQRVVIISKYYWSDDFLLPVQFFTSYSNFWFLG